MKEVFIRTLLTIRTPDHEEEGKRGKAPELLPHRVHHHRVILAPIFPRTNNDGKRGLGLAFAIFPQVVGGRSLKIDIVEERINDQSLKKLSRIYLCFFYQEWILKNEYEAKIRDG